MTRTRTILCQISPALQLSAGGEQPHAVQGVGYRPLYPKEASADLKRALYAARHLLAGTCTSLQDQVTQTDLLPMLLQVQASSRRSCPIAA